MALLNVHRVAASRRIRDAGSGFVTGGLGPTTATPGRFLDAIEQHLLGRLGTSTQARTGAVAFIHRFGSALNA